MSPRHTTERNTSERRIALTFDDGPSAWTEPILDILAANKASATFFVIGSLVAARSHVLERILAEGHEVGNHSWSHPRLARDCDDERIHEELARTNDAIAAAVGRAPHRFRAPYYDVDQRVETVASRLGLAHTPGTVTPPDWRPSVRSGLLVTLVLQLIRPSGIIGLHDGIPPHELNLPGASREVTVETVAAVLPRLTEAGYVCVTASSLLAAGGPL